VPRRFGYLWPVVAALSPLLAAHEALAKSIDNTPRPTIILKGATKFLAQDGWDSVALYDAANGQPIHRFSAGARVEMIDLTADEKSLLVACGDGSLSLWDLATGENLWRKTPTQTGLPSVADACFAWDGRSFVVANFDDAAVVFDSGTGGRIGAATFPPRQVDVMSAALTPDGSRGVLIDLDNRVFTFDLRTGAMRDTGVMGASPVRCSADGKYAAFRSSNNGSDDWLRVLTLDANPTFRDVVKLGYIHIRPVEDGDFLATGTRREGGTGSAVGVRCHPATGEVEEVWKVQGGAELARMDFDPGTLRGVYTDFRLVTRVLDLRTEAELLKIDNSANYREEIISTTVMGGEPGSSNVLNTSSSNVLNTSYGGFFWPSVAAVVGLVLVALVAVVFWRGRRV
jgi:WD40 repeat protein